MILDVKKSFGDEFGFFIVLFRSFAERFVIRSHIKGLITLEVLSLKVVRLKFVLIDLYRGCKSVLTPGYLL